MFVLSCSARCPRSWTWPGNSLLHGYPGGHQQESCRTPGEVDEFRQLPGHGDPPHVHQDGQESHQGSRCPEEEDSLRHRASIVVVVFWWWWRRGRKPEWPEETQDGTRDGQGTCWSRLWRKEAVNLKLHRHHPCWWMIFEMHIDSQFCPFFPSMQSFCFMCLSFLIAYFFFSSLNLTSKMFLICWNLSAVGVRVLFFPFIHFWNKSKGQNKFPILCGKCKNSFHQLMGSNCFMVLQHTSASSLMLMAENFQVWICLLLLIVIVYCFCCPVAFVSFHIFQCLLRFSLW